MRRGRSTMRRTSAKRHQFPFRS